MKSDFSEIARESIRKEQEDIRKQHKEALETTLAPLAKELGEFKTKVENFNENGIKNTTSIIEKITNLENSLLVKSNELTKYEKIIADYIKNGVKNESENTENNSLSEIDEFNQEIGL